MAVLGRLPQITQFFKDKPAFIEAFKYFEQALNVHSEVHKRIQTLPMNAFEKVPLEHGMFALEQKFYSKARDLCFFESHKKYIDIQLIVSGEELMEYCDIQKCTVEQSYSVERDLITYVMHNNTTKVLLQSGDFGIFFPEDVHLGCQQNNESSLCTKTVIKIPLEYF